MFQDQAQRQLGCEGLILCIIMVISAGLQRRYNLSLKRYCRNVFHLTSSSSGHIRRFFCFGHEHEVSLYLPPSSMSGNHLRSGYLKTLVTCLLHCNDDDDQQNTQSVAPAPVHIPHPHAHTIASTHSRVTVTVTVTSQYQCNTFNVIECSHDHVHGFLCGGL